MAVFLNCIVFVFTVDLCYFQLYQTSLFIWCLIWRLLNAKLTNTHNIECSISTSYTQGSENFTEDWAEENKIGGKGGELGTADFWQ